MIVVWLFFLNAIKIMFYQPIVLYYGQLRKFRFNRKAICVRVIHTNVLVNSIQRYFLVLPEEILHKIWLSDGL